MALHKYIDPMLLLQNQLIDPFLRYRFPFLSYGLFHLSLTSGLPISSMEGLFNVSPTLFNGVHVGRGRGVRHKDNPVLCTEASTAIRLRFVTVSRVSIGFFKCVFVEFRSSRRFCCANLLYSIEPLRGASFCIFLNWTG